MNRSASFHWLPVALVALVALGGCRGKFGSEACDSKERLDVPANASAALYYDNSGKLLAIGAEDMTGTSENKMCPTPPLDDDPGQCKKAGYCVVNINGTDYCLKC